MDTDDDGDAAADAAADGDDEDDDADDDDNGDDDDDDDDDGDICLEDIYIPSSRFSCRFDSGQRLSVLRQGRRPPQWRST